jgi:hypothetical protein
MYRTCRHEFSVSVTIQFLWKVNIYVLWLYSSANWNVVGTTISKV